MPTYSYRCSDCEHAFDIRQSITEDSLTICPQCQGTLRKQFSSVGISFKGSGFYRNDSRAPSKSQGEKATASKTEKAGASTTEKSGNKEPSAKSSSPKGSGDKKPVTSAKS